MLVCEQPMVSARACHAVPRISHSELPQNRCRQIQIQCAAPQVQHMWSQMELANDAP